MDETQNDEAKNIKLAKLGLPPIERIREILTVALDHARRDSKGGEIDVTCYGSHVVGGVIAWTQESDPILLLAEMKGEIGWNHQSRRWSAYTTDGTLHDGGIPGGPKNIPGLIAVFGDDARSTVFDLHARWVDAGRPDWPVRRE